MSQRSPLKLVRSDAAPAPSRAPAASSWEVLGGGTEPGHAAAELWLGLHLDASGAQQLEQLALRAQRFTPRVCLEPPDGLLLEVKGSLHLFGGIEGLTRAVTDECLTLGAKPTLALAPRPLAALVAARAGATVLVTGLAQLVGKLAPLPLAALRWPEETCTRLASMGVRTIGQVLKLPRAGFARRFGPEQLALLDRLTGREPDLRQRFAARERFRRRRELLYELCDHERIQAALTPLLAALGGFLTSRQQGLMQLECRLWHRQGPPTSCVLGLAAPLADIQRLTELLGERLRTLALTQPVRGLELRSGALVPLALPSGSLWQSGEHGGSPAEEGCELIERLQARLGSEAVYGLTVRPSHRPETAWGSVQPVLDRNSSCKGRMWAPAPPPLPPAWPAGRRPVWLLRVPQRLSQRAGRPWRHGLLQRLAGPERIETGWWDGGEVRRDYYIARDIHGVRLWIFREHTASRGWYLHGVFG